MSTSPASIHHFLGDLLENPQADQWIDLFRDMMEGLQSPSQMRDLIRTGKAFYRLSSAVSVAGPCDVKQDGAPPS